MKRRRDPRRELARKLSGAKLKEPPELCTRCVWAMRESGRPVCRSPAACGAVHHETSLKTCF